MVKSVKAQTSSASKKQVEKKTMPDLLIDIIIVLMYAMVEMFPQLNAVDSMGSQWLYLSVLNVVVSFYIINKRKFISNFVLKSAAFISLVGLIIVSALSFFASYNIIESIVTYSRLIIAFIAFLNLVAILSSNKSIVSPAITALAIMVVFQSLFVVAKFYNLSGSHLKLDDLILSIRGNTGNKNFLGVSILLKIPFVVYFFQCKSFFMRILSAIGIFIACLALFIINSRSTYIGLLLESAIYLSLMILFYLKEKNKQALIKAGIYAGMILLSFGLTQVVFYNIEKQKVRGSYGSVTQRIESISFSNEGSSGRVRLWQSAVDFISKHILLGGGYGNWKIHSVPYEATSISGFGTRKHVHNDYLEVTADTGIIGGVFYCVFFVALIFYCAKIILKQNKDKDIQTLAIVLLMSQVAYMSDSFFNFPMERPNLFLLMLFSSASIIVLHRAKINVPEQSSSQFNLHKSLIILIVILSVCSIYISIQAYKSMAVQNKVYVEWFGKTRTANPPFKSAEVNPLFPSIPNLNELAMPIANMKAKYLAQEGKLDEALAVLNADKNSNPYLYFTEYTKANIALARQQFKLAFYYAKIAYYNRPANQQLYNFVYDLSKEMHDTVEMQKAYLTKTKTRPEATDYLKHSQTMFVLNKNFDTRINTINEGLKIFPHDPELNFQINFDKGLVFSNQSENIEAIASYSEALKYEDNPITNQNIGFIYFNMKKFTESIPYLTNAINSNQFRDGKTEYFRGHCYYQLKQMENACKDFHIASSFGFSVEPQMTQLCTGYLK